MHHTLEKWYNKYLSDPEAVILIFIISLVAVTAYFFGGMLAPVFAGVVLAYLLEWGVWFFQRHKVPRTLAVIITFSLFIALLVIGIVFIAPILGRQLTGLFEDLPNMVTRTQELLYLLPGKFPEIITQSQVDNLINGIALELRKIGRLVLSVSIATIPIFFAALIYLVLVPFLIFFFLKDKSMLIEWVVSFLPKEKALLTKVWQEVDLQLGNYIRGKVAEIFIVGSIVYLFFLFFNLKYAALLASLVGVSVLIPYVGAFLVTLPVVLVAYFQFGFSSEFFYVSLGYIVLQILDGNVLVPLLFSEAVNLHPVAIIIAIIIFGGLWGVWGVFFAIPLAVLVRAIVYAWPKHEAAAA